MREAEPVTHPGVEEAAEAGSDRGKFPERSSGRGELSLPFPAASVGARAMERFAPKGCPRVARLMLALNFMPGMLAQYPEARMEALHSEGRGVWFATNLATAVVSARGPTPSPNALGTYTVLLTVCVVSL